MQPLTCWNENVARVASNANKKHKQSKLSSSHCNCKRIYLPTTTTASKSYIYLDNVSRCVQQDYYSSIQKTYLPATKRTKLQTISNKRPLSSRLESRNYFQFWNSPEKNGSCKGCKSLKFETKHHVSGNFHENKTRLKQSQLPARGQAKRDFNYYSLHSTLPIVLFLCSVAVVQNAVVCQDSSYADSHNNNNLVGNNIVSTFYLGGHYHNINSCFLLVARVEKA